MFWTTDLVASSPINKLLEDENVSLETILEQEDVLQECKLGNQKLIEYLTRPDIMVQLIKLITTEPPPGLNEKNRYKYANMACEVLSCEGSPIGETFGSNSSYVSQLFDKIRADEPLNPLLASFICKILHNLPQSSSKAIFEFTMTSDDFVSSLVKHIGTSAIMDLLFTSIARLENPAFQNILVSFYHQQNLIGRLVGLFKKDVDPSAQANAAQFLCDLIRFSREQQTFHQGAAEPNPLLDEIESTSTISEMLNNMFEARTEQCLVNGIQVLQALLEYQRYRANIQPKQPAIETDLQFQTGDYEAIPQYISPPMYCNGDAVPPDQMTALDIERLTKSVRQVHAAIVPRLVDFHSLLINPPPKNPIRTTIGIIEKPFGATRVEVVHLIRALLSSNNPQINKKLAELNVLPVLVDLFFDYPYNNFLHTQVEQSIKCILDNAKSTSPPVTSPTESGPPTSSETSTATTEVTTAVPTEPVGNTESAKMLIKQLLVDHNLIQRILDAYETYRQQEKRPNPRPSYMGHIIKIANHLQSYKDVDSIKPIIDQIPASTLEQWNQFVEDTLNRINLRIRSPLVDSGFTVFTEEKYANEDASRLGNLPREVLDFSEVQQIREMTENLNLSHQEFNPIEFRKCTEKDNIPKEEKQTDE